MLASMSNTEKLTLIEAQYNYTNYYTLTQCQSLDHQILS